MSKYRDNFWTDDGLRLQAVVPDGKERFPQPRSPQYPNSGEGPDTEEDVVVALTWPQDAGWRRH